jgi:hypothetical protein
MTGILILENACYREFEYFLSFPPLAKIKNYNLSFLDLRGEK